MVNVFYTPFRYKGITEILLKSSLYNTKGPDYSNILYIAPTPRKIKDGKQKFHGLVEHCYITPEMMTIKQLSKRLYTIHGDKNIISKSLMPIIISQLTGKGIGFSSIIADFITEVKQYYPNKDVETIKKELEAVLHELGIPEEVSHRAMAAIEIYKAYQEFLTEQSAIDENDMMATSPELIKRHRYMPEILILDGFYELTRSEEIVLKSIIENSKDVFISIPYDNNFHDITYSYINFIKYNFQIVEIFLPLEEQTMELSYHPYPGIDEEIEGIARHLKNSFISGKLRELEKIIVTFPNLNSCSYMITRIFRRYGIPCTISNPEPAGKKRPFLDLIALLESVADDFPRLQFTRFLSSTHFKNIPSLVKKWIPTLCLRSGIIKGKDAWLNLFKTKPDNGKSLIPDFSSIYKEIKRIFNKLSPLESIKNKGTYGQYSEVVIKLLGEFEFSAVSNQNTDFKEQIVDVLKNLSFIDNLFSYPSHPGHITLQQFIDSLKHVLNVMITEEEGTGVQIMNFFETRGLEPEYIYFGGLKDGDLPSKPDIDHILPDSVRTKLGLVNLKKYLLLQRFLFQRTIASTQNLHLSYAVMEGDKLFLPSPFLPRNNEKQEHIPGIFSKEEELLTKGKHPLEVYITEIEDVGKYLIGNKFGKNSSIRVTDIDSYRTCPRRFFIEKVLKLTPPETKEYEVEAVLLGTIAHEIMQHLISKPFEEIGELKVMAEVLIDKLLLNKPIEDFWKKLIKDSFLTFLPEIYELERNIRDEGYSFMKAEVPVEGEIISGIKLKGKIDRIDRKSDKKKMVELIDYKTGTRQFSGPQVLAKGVALQLFIYAALLKSQGFEVERAGIYSLKDMSLSWVPGAHDRRNERTIEDYIKASLVFLEETVHKMRKGYFSAYPLNEQICRNCPEKPYCPYLQKTIAGS